MGNENLNPFSAKGHLGFASFVGTILVAVIVNLIVYAFIRSGLISARVSFDKQQIAIFYGLWFVTASVGFSIVGNAFIKRWADILLSADIGRLMKALLRFSLLSPALGLPITVLTLLFFPQSPLMGVKDGGSKSQIGLSLLIVLLLSVGSTFLIPNSFFGFERIAFRESTRPYVTRAFYDGKNPMPSDSELKPALAVATPMVRYLAWLASDMVRTKMLSVAVETEPKKLCIERLGFISVEVQDCYFNQLRKMTELAPMAAPYFALYFESEYRKRVTEPSPINTDARSPEPTAVERIAGLILMTSNMLELLEPGTMYIERTHIAKPVFLLRAFASPELPLIEAGQDAQRVTIVEKLLPMIDMQVDAVKRTLSETGSMLGPDEITVKAELRKVEVRLAAVRKDPLMLAMYAH